MIGHLFSKFASLYIDDFHKTKQISNDFDRVLKITFLERCTFFKMVMFQYEFIKYLRSILFVGRFWMIGHLFQSLHHFRLMIFIKQSRFRMILIAS